MADPNPNTHDWASTQFVREHLASASQYIAEAFVDRSVRWYSRCSHESPLEVAFEIWWYALERAGSVDGGTVGFRRQVEVTANGNRYRLDYQLTPQEPLLSRANTAGISFPKIAVELDGHDFHERTKEQVAYRNQRDRDLQADGWLLLHYSGSEFHRDPVRCIDEAFGHAYRAFGWDFEMVVIEAEMAAEREAASK